MINFEKFRLPYRQDAAFSLLAFCVFLIPLAFSQYAYESFESVKFGLFLILTGGSLLVFFFQQKPGHSSFQYNKYLYLILAAFGFWAAVGSIFAQDHFYAIFGFYARFTSGLVFYAALLVFVGLLLAMLDEGRLYFLLKILVADALVVSVISYLQGFGWIFYAGFGVDGFFRGPSLLGNINYSAMFLASVLPLAVYFFTQSRGLAIKIYYFLCVFFIIFALLLLASRGALLAMALACFTALALLVIFKLQKKFIWGILITILALGLLGGSLLRIIRPAAISSIISVADANTLDRFYAWQLSVNGIVHSPWLGSGPGNYVLFFQQARLPAPEAAGNGGQARLASSVNQVGIFDDAHNLFLHLAVTGGLPLALLFLALLVCAVGYGLKGLRQQKNLLPVALLSSLTAWVAAACFNPVPVPMYLLLGVLLAGLAVNFLAKKQINFNFNKKIPFALLACLLIAWGSISLISEHLLRFSAIAYSEQNYSKAYTLSSLAFKINPTNELFIFYKAASGIYLNKTRAETEEDIKSIINLHPLLANVYVDVSNLYGLLVYKNANKDDLNLAIANMETSIKLDPLFADRYGQVALYYYQLGDLAKAKQYTEKNLGLNSGNFSAWILLAKLHQLENNRQAVISDLTEAFKLRPSLTQLKYLLYLAKHLSNVSQVPIEISARTPDVN